MLRRTKLSGVLVGDRWGESMLLSAEERVAVWARVTERCGDGAQVLAGISECGVAQARVLLRRAVACGCVAAVLDAPRLESLASQPGTSELFFRSVADTADVPVLIRVRLGRGSECLAPEAVGSLASHPRITGALVHSDSADLVVAVSEACGAAFSILVADLELAVPCLRGSACAAVLSLASIVPFYALSIEEAVRTRETSAATELVARAAPLSALLKRHGVPAMKSALDMRGSYGGTPRLPLLRLDPTAQGDVSRALHGLAS